MDNFLREQQRLIDAVAIFVRAVVDPREADAVGPEHSGVEVRRLTDGGGVGGCASLVRRAPPSHVDRLA